MLHRRQKTSLCNIESPMLHGWLTMGLRNKREDVLSKEEVEGMINISNNERDKVLIMFLFLTGARISEVLRMKPKDFEPDNMGRVKINIITLKRKEKRMVEEKRTIYINIDAPYILDILNYVSCFSPDEKLFKISRVHAWRIINKLNKNAWCHLFRDTRATRLVFAGWSTDQLMQYFGWTSRNSPDSYIRRSGKMIENLGGTIK